jgi:hypothetical protein
MQTAVAECDKSISNKEFGDVLDSFSMGFVAKNPSVLQEKSELGLSMIPCLAEPITPELSFRFHLLIGLYHYVNTEYDLRDESFQIAKQINPEVGIDYFLYPEGHELHDVYENLVPAELILLKRPPVSGYYMFDGREIAYRPENSPSIVQIIENDVVLKSEYVLPSDKLPEVSVPDSSETIPKQSNFQFAKNNVRRTRNVFIVASVTSFTAMTATGLYYYSNGFDSAETRANRSTIAAALFVGNNLFLTSTILTGTGAVVISVREYLDSVEEATVETQNEVQQLTSDEQGKNR